MTAREICENSCFPRTRKVAVRSPRLQMVPQASWKVRYRATREAISCWINDACVRKVQPWALANDRQLAGGHFAFDGFHPDSEQLHVLLLALV